MQAEDIVTMQGSVKLQVLGKVQSYTHGIEERRLMSILFKNGVTKEIEEVITHLINADKVDKVMGQRIGSQKVQSWIVIK